MTRLSAKRSITINGHSTSVTLENGFWQSLKEIAAEQQTSVNMLIEHIDQAQPDNLSSAIRLYILNHYKSKISAAAGANG